MFLWPYYLPCYKNDWLKNNQFDIHLFLFFIYPAYLLTDLNSKETNIYEITSGGWRSQILLFLFSSFIFKENHILVEEGNPSRRRTRCYWWYRWHRKLRGFIKNSDHPWRMWESLSTRCQAFFRLIDVPFVTNFIGESIPSIGMCNIENQ